MRVRSSELQSDRSLDLDKLWREAGAVPPGPIHQLQPRSDRQAPVGQGPQQGQHDEAGLQH